MSNTIEETKDDNDVVLIPSSIRRSLTLSVNIEALAKSTKVNIKWWSKHESAGITELPKENRMDVINREAIQNSREEGFLISDLDSKLEDFLIAYCESKDLPDVNVTKSVVLS